MSNAMEEELALSARVLTEPVGLQQRRTRAVIRAQLRLGSSDGSALEWPARRHPSPICFSWKPGKKGQAHPADAPWKSVISHQDRRGADQPLTNRQKATGVQAA
jgi:hypothetical protein